MNQLVDSSLGLLGWCCPRCKLVDIQFYTFFMETRREFTEMHTEFASLFAKFRRSRELFSKYGHLNEFLKSEKLIN